MEQLIKKFKLIGGALITLCCFLPFITVNFGFFGSGYGNAFSLLLLGGKFTYTMFILLILAGAGGLVFVNLTKDIALGPKFTLSFVAKLAALAGGATLLMVILATPYAGVGFGLILEILIAGSLLLEDIIVAAITKNGGEKQDA